MNPIIQQAVKHYSGAFLISRHVHDFVQYQDEKNDMVYFDGGTEYLRRSTNFPGVGCEDYTLLKGDPHELIMKKLLWGTRGKNGKSQLEYFPISTFSFEHLKALKSSTQWNSIPDFYKEAIEYWYEKKNDGTENQTNTSSGESDRGDSPVPLHPKLERLVKQATNGGRGSK